MFRSWARLLCRFTVPALLASLIAANGGCERNPAAGAPQTPPKPRNLTILTPHSERIRETFEEGFWNWYLREQGTPVEITWVYRGTPQCVEYARETSGAQDEGHRLPPADVLFGGGLNDHARLADEGLARPVDVGAAVAVPTNGAPARDADGHWHACGLSSFGILYNADACAARGIAPPTTWADLADPRFFGWVAIADPEASGSARECMVLILQHVGWVDGWSTLIRILANARALDPRSGDALRQVQAGTALATFAVNFDGMALAAESDGRLVYVDPPSATAAKPDFISVLSTAPNSDVALAFVQYVLSEEGQALWGVQRDARPPYGQTLYHYPISPAIYDKYAGHLTVPRNPVKDDFGIRADTQQSITFGHLVKPLVHAACGKDLHANLQQTWHAVFDAGLPANALAELTTSPVAPDTLEAAAQTVTNTGSPEAQTLVSTWAEQFARQYAHARELLRP